MIGNCQCGFTSLSLYFSSKGNLTFNMSFSITVISLPSLHPLVYFLPKRPSLPEKTFSAKRSSFGIGSKSQDTINFSNLIRVGVYLISQEKSEVFMRNFASIPTTIRTLPFYFWKGSPPAPFSRCPLPQLLLPHKQHLSPSQFQFRTCLSGYAIFGIPPHWILLH